LKEIDFMCGLPEWRGIENAAGGARHRRRGERPALLLGCAVTLGIAGSVLFHSPQAFARGPESLADLADAVSDSVVNISATQTIDERHAGNPPELGPGTPFDDLFEEFFRRHQQGGGERPDQKRHERKSNSLGSGFVVDPAGIVITNNHVIDDANEVTVILNDGQKLKAEIVGKDEKVDVAVLRVKPEKPLKAAKFGDSDKMRVGDWVVAVGNPFGLGGTVTAGIISARHRNLDGPYDNYFQTDAAINKGNSGGPLFNMAGEVIGVNTAILSPSGGSIGIGFATPSATIVPVIDQLQKYGETRRGWLGVRIQNVDDMIAESLNLGKLRGALVAGTDDKGPATAAGIKAGDVIIKFDGTEIKEWRDLPKIVAATPVGKVVEIVVIRKDKQITKTIKLGRLEEIDKRAALGGKRGESGMQTPQGPVEKALGMEFSSLSEELRQRYAIKSTVASGVVITNVDPDSSAAEKRVQPGDVVMEINQEPIKEPADISKKLDALKKSGKKSALLLVANGQGEPRYVALGLP
jgi:serine protease Do